MNAQRKKAPAGFSLVELITSMGISMMLILATVATYSMCGRMIESNRIRNNLNGSVRMAMDYLMRDLTMAGYGFSDHIKNMSAWVTWVSGTTNPLVIPSTNAVRLTGAFERVAALQAPTTAGQTVIHVGTNAAAQLNTSNRKLILIGNSELARITAISGGQLTISTDPGTAKGLKWNYQSNAPVELVQVITYAITNYAGRSHITRTDAARPQTWLQDWIHLDTILSTDVVGLQIVRTGQIARITMTGRSSDPDRNLVRGTNTSPYRTLTVKTSVMMRNPTAAGGGP